MGPHIRVQTELIYDDESTGVIVKASLVGKDGPERELIKCTPHNSPLEIRNNTFSGAKLLEH